MIVYKVKNLVNGKIYVGRTKHTLSARKHDHLKAAKNGCRYAFHRALRKYGVDNFDWREIMQCDDEEDLNETEVATIKALKTKIPNGYNMTDGGEGVIGITEEGRERKRKAMLGNQHSKGIKHSAEFCEIQRQRMLGYCHSDKAKRKIGEASRRRKTASAETRAKIGAAMRGKPSRMKGKKHSEETKLKISERTKKALARPDVKLRHSIGNSKPKSAEHKAAIATALRGKKHTNERRLGQSLAQRKRHRKANIAKIRAELSKLLQKDKK